MQQKTILIAGCGDVGSTFGSLLIAEGHKVIGLRRNINQLPQGIQGISADLLQTSALKEQLSTLTGCDVLVYAVAANGYDEERYRQAYVQGLDNVLNALPVAPKHIIFTSSTGVYHQNDHSFIDEHSPCQPQSFSGQVMLEAENNVLGKEPPATIVRFSGIYGPGREFLINKIKQGEVAPEIPLQYSNRIHRDDCAGVLHHLVTKLFRGENLDSCYLASDDCPASLFEVGHWLAEQFDVVPQSASLSRRTGSKRCNNQRLKDSGYQFIYPDYKAGYLSLISQK